MQTKALFIDRDGTLIYEPEDEQIDSLEKLEFLPGMFRNLYYIQHILGYKLIMVTNQDGLGTADYPQAKFDKVQEKLLTALANEGIRFDEIRMDKSRASAPSQSRKPNTGMVEDFLHKDWDWLRSFVIGDRCTDVQLAKNMDIQGIYIAEDDKELKENQLEDAAALVTNHWDEIFAYLRNLDKTAQVLRTTHETAISVDLRLMGSGKANIGTGIGFFDHMLEQLVRHGGFDLMLKVSGDLEVDAHHTIEDTALALGEAFAKALGNKKGLQRYGFVLPMDDALAQVAIDFGGRPWLVWNATFAREKIGKMPTEMFMHFFKSFSDAAYCNLNIRANGVNEHHKIEAIFKALGRAIKMALRQDLLDTNLPTTKGKL